MTFTDSESSEGVAESQFSNRIKQSVKLDPESRCHSMIELLANYYGEAYLVIGLCLSLGLLGVCLPRFRRSNVIPISAEEKAKRKAQARAKPKAAPKRK